ncbi:MAG: TonB-dependent receptor plug domain-containing protein [Chitinivibrionales bacterium]|nr:TonB-dependent receptor plug domain-containing protein [Chitinivibrionales bacterium]
MIKKIDGIYSAIGVLIFVLILPVTAEKKSLPAVSGNLKGVVLDNRTRRPVEGAVVKIITMGYADTTDSAGTFQFDGVPVGHCDIEVNSDKHELRIFPSITVKSGENDRIVFEIRKEDLTVNLDKVTVRGRRVMTKSSGQFNSVQKLSRDEVLLSPGSSQDPNLILQTLPSVVSGTDYGFNRFLVRGGRDDENIFLIDGIEANNLSHWGTAFGSGGAITKLHVDFLRTMDFYAGGVPTRYPPKLSSVTDIHFRDGSMEHQKYQFDLNMAGAGIFLEGPIAKGKSSYMLNMRVSFLDIMQLFMDFGGVPQYQNGQLKVAWNVDKNNKLTTNLLAGHEIIEVTEEDDAEHITSEGYHAIGGIEWRNRHGIYENKLLFSGEYQKFEETGTMHDSIMLWEWKNLRTRFQLKDDYSLFIRTRDVFSTGFVVEKEEFKNGVVNEEYFVFADTAGDLSYDYYKHMIDTTVAGAPVLFTSAQHVDLEAKNNNYRIGGHAGYTMYAGPVKVHCGIRDDYFTLSEKHGISPRGGVALDFGKVGTFSISSGLYYQFPAYLVHITTDQLTNDVQLWDVDLQRNMQGVFGYEKQLSDYVVLGSEFYYKLYDKEPLYRIVSPANAPGKGMRQIVIKPDRYSEKKAYGFELYIHKKKLDNLYYQFSYTFYNSLQEYENNEWYVSDENLRNCASLILGSNFNKNHRLSMRFDFSEGRPYTPIDQEVSFLSGETVYDFADGWNSKRRPMRTKLALRYDATWYFRWGNITSYFEIKNVLNQKDIVAEYYSLGDRFPEGEIKQFKGQGIMPVGGFKLDF